MPRLLATADLHYNHPRSRPLAEQLIDQMNRAGGDILLVAGDTATSDGEALEQCLARFQFAGPKLFLAGNHELWTTTDDSHRLFTEDLPRRVRALGWQWLETDPFIAADTAIVGTIGWYDYGFAQPDLEIPHAFYEQKISPGAACRFPEYAPLLANAPDLSPRALATVARWNDGIHIKLGRSDEQFLAERLAELERSLQTVASVNHIIAATHVVPFKELLPPPRIPQWDFAKAFLGSPKLGELLLRYPNVRHAVCGHSHFLLEAKIGPAHLHAINLGSGYRWKTFRTLDLA